MNVYGESVAYIDMGEEEMMDALEEFLPLLAKPEQEWINYTERQMEFKSKLTPLHMELYLSRGVPCESYLQKYRH